MSVPRILTGRRPGAPLLVGAAALCLTVAVSVGVAAPFANAVGRSTVTTESSPAPVPNGRVAASPVTPGATPAADRTSPSDGPAATPTPPVNQDAPACPAATAPLAPLPGDDCDAAVVIDASATPRRQLVHVGPGAVVAVRLPERAGSTGFSWVVTKLPAGWTLLGERTVPAAGPGAAGLHVFRLRAGQSGSGTLRLALTRPWSGEIARTVRIRVAVSTASDVLPPCCKQLP